jgi:RNA-directed DNA polymerase
VRKHGDKFIITPSKGSVKSMITKARKIMKANLGKATLDMIRQLNSAIRGWANYHRHICSKATYAYIDRCIHKNLWNWAKRRHKGKGKRWIRKRYFRKVGSRNWSFFATDRTEKSVSKTIDLLLASMTKIVRHVKIRAKANPYIEDWQKYFSQRLFRKHFEAVLT